LAGKTEAASHVSVKRLHIVHNVHCFIYTACDFAVLCKNRMDKKPVYCEHVHIKAKLARIYIELNIIQKTCNSC
jgi:hypothetical protein